MKICLICSEPIPEGEEITVPRYRREPPSFIHKSCLWMKLAHVCQNREYEAKLRYLVEYEERNKSDSPREFSEGTADAAWELSDVKLAPHELKKLKDEHLVSVILPARRPYYCLTSRELTKKFLETLEKPITTPGEKLKIPDDLFETIIGYDDIKQLFLASLKADMPMFRHFLLIGPPHSGKTTFLLELERIPGAFMVGGESGPTRVGLRELILSVRPKLLLIDEIDKMDKVDREFLLGPADEYARTSVVKHGEIRSERLNLRIFAAANPPKSRFSPQFLDRFWVIEFPPYSRDEFVEIVRNLLMRRRGLEESLAVRIGEEIWNVTQSIRDALRVAEAVKAGLSLEHCLNVMRKYRR